jgi:two-component system, NarL family, response regulator DevR
VKQECGVTNTGESRIRVVLVDDHAMIRRGLRDHFAREADIEVTGEAGTAATAVPLVCSVRPDVAVLDVQLPDGDGVSVCRAIRSAVPETACLMLTGFDDDQALVGAIMAGAAGYVKKENFAKLLVPAVRDVAAGRSALDAHAAEVAMTLLREQLAAGPGLSDRDRQVLDLIGQGLTDQQIAHWLSVPAETAKAEVRALLRKLGLVGNDADSSLAGR